MDLPLIYAILVVVSWERPVCNDLNIPQVPHFPPSKNDELLGSIEGYKCINESVGRFNGLLDPPLTASFLTPFQG